MSGLDFSNCKKISQDKNSATFHHKDGHEIKIAIAGLSPTMRKRLEKLPLHQSGESEEAQGVVEAPQEQAPGANPAAENQEQVAVVEPQSPMPPQAPQEQTPESAPAEAPLTASEPAPVSDAPPAQAAAPVQKSPQDRYAEHMRVAEDLANRKITPETYGDLFAKRSTLGKIGTIFGMILSGAGSALAHQPNMLLQMMDKQIDQDLEAQKQNKTGAQNFLNAQYQHNLQQAQTAYTLQQVKASEGEHAGEYQANLAVNKKLVKNAGGTWDDSLEKSNAMITAENDAKSKMLLATGQHLDDVTANNPAANAAVKNVIHPAIAKKVKELDDKSDAAVKLNTDLYNKKKAAMPKDFIKSSMNGVDEKKMNELINNGRLAAANPKAAALSDQIPPGEVPKIDDEVAGIRMNRNIASEYNDTFQKLKAAKLAGNLNPAYRKALINQLNNKIAVDTTHRFVTAEAKNQMDSIFPEKFDYGKARPEKFEKMMQTFKDNEGQFSTLQRYGLKQPFPSFTYEGPKEEIKVVNGIKYKRGPNGEAVRVKK